MEFVEERVYTPVNVDELVEGSYGYFADSYSALKRNVANKQAAFYGKVSSDKVYEDDQPFVINGKFHYRYFYLVEKPGQSIAERPYKSIDEMYRTRFVVESEEVKETTIAETVLSMDDFDVKQKFSGSYYKITGINFKDGGAVLIDGQWYSLKLLFEYYEWADGRVCGVKEE